MCQKMFRAIFFASLTQLLNHLVYFPLQIVQVLEFSGVVGKLTGIASYIPVAAVHQQA